LTDVVVVVVVVVVVIRMSLHSNSCPCLNYLAIEYTVIEPEDIREERKRVFNETEEKRSAIQGIVFVMLCFSTIWLVLRNGSL